jgi:glycosyltransferase involved in cell wall biosynthesis
VVFHFAGTKKKKETNVKHNQVTGERISFDDPDICFEQYIKGQCEKNYVYHGIADEILKFELLRECNYFVLPSYSEGFSVAVLEALSMGKPVVTTPVGALADVVNPEVNGLLSIPGNLDSLKSNIIRLLSDKELRDRMALTNARYVRNHFSVREISEQIGNCFLQVLTK